MSKFNTKEKSNTTKTINFAGGDAFDLSSKQKLISLLWNSFLENSFYEKQEIKLNRFQEALAAEPDKKFIAKLALYTRNVLGMRSTSHIAAVEIAKSVKNEEWSKRFFNKVIHRVDDMSEIISAYKQNGGNSLPHSLLKGFKQAFNKFDNYQLTKYQGNRKDWKLLDVINLVRPKPTQKNEEALKNLISSGKLVNKDTWEAKLSYAGQKAENDVEKEELKKEAWKELILSRKIGYFALLRNLRNIILQAPELVPDACKLLIDENLIKKSLVFPFRYLSAYKEISELKGVNGIQDVMIHLSWALDICMKNVPTFDGKTLIAIDSSSSMLYSVAKNSKATVSNISTLFGATFLKSNNSADIILFDTNAKYINVNPLDSTLTICQKISDSIMGGATNFHEIFRVANKKYDRIIILSDMQGWGQFNVSSYFNKYKEKYNCNPLIYSFNLEGYGSIQFPETQTICIDGFSEKVLELMEKLEVDKNAIIQEINAVEL